jgi:GMP synthase (glutamine-hydrolysing)
MKHASTDTVLIIDFGSQVTQLIARRVREAGVHSEIVPFQSAEAAFRRLNPKGVILSGGPASTHEAGSPRAPQVVFEAGIPVLGICYGQMAMCVQMGGVAEGSDHREFGRAFVQIEKDCPLFEGLWTTGQRHQVWMSHGDRVISLPTGFEVFGRSEGAPFAIF